MLVAIIAALAAALIAVAAVAVVLVVRSRRSSPSVGQTKGVSQLDTVGVGSSPFERRSAAKGAREGDVTVSSSEGGLRPSPPTGFPGALPRWASLRPASSGC